MKWLLLSAAALSLCACSTVTPDLPVSDSAGPNHSGIYATSYNTDGSLRTQWWFEDHREDYNKLILAYGTKYGVTADSHLTKAGAYWKADAVARKQYIELNEIKKMDQFGLTLPKSL